MTSNDKIILLMDYMLDKYNLRNNFIVKSYLGNLEDRIRKMSEKEANDMISDIKNIIDKE